MLLLLLFAASGCAALIYEIVWLQMLELVVGSSAVSIAVLLSAYMGGLCAGSFLLPRVIRPERNALRVYGYIELGIGSLGIAMLWLLPLVRYVYAGFPSIWLRGVVCGICLLPPTLLMGASLPAIARVVETSRLGFLYAANTVGAVVGCSVAGFYLLRVYDMPTATCVAAGINGAVALAAFWWGRGKSTAKGAGENAYFTSEKESQDSKVAVYFAIGLSGAAALGAEVVWTRLLSLLMGATVYTFSIILAVFLAGIGLGSGVGTALARRRNAQVWLGVCQFLLAGSIAWSAWMICASLPYWPIDPRLSLNPWVNFQLDLVRCLWAILPATMLWGASFPLALAAAARDGEDAGKLSGGIYAANTIGAIVGAIAFTLVLIPGIGTQRSQQVLIVLSVLAALFALRSVKVLAIAGIAASALLAWSVPAAPWKLIAYGRRMPSSFNTGKPLYVGEGMNSSIVVSEWTDGKRLFHISGKTEASNEAHDLRLERMLGHIPAMLHRKPESVLIVGFGAGVTAGSFAPYPEIKRIVICEMEPLVPPATTRFFAHENYGVLHDPRTTIVYDDARHYMLTSREKFDIITSDPIHPFVKGSATLYSKEYFELVKARLNRGGMVTQWVPLYDSDMGTVKSEVATFFEAFPQATAWSNDVAELGYDMVMLGQAEPLRIDTEALQARLDQPGYTRVKESLNDVHLGSALDLVSTYSGRGADFRDWLKDAEINRDRNLRLQYLAGMGVDQNGSFAIYWEMMKRFQYPEDLFVVPLDKKAALKKLLGFTK